MADCFVGLGHGWYTSERPGRPYIILDPASICHTSQVHYLHEGRPGLCMMGLLFPIKLPVQLECHTVHVTKCYSCFYFLPVIWKFKQVLSVHVESRWQGAVAATQGCSSRSMLPVSCCLSRRAAPCTPQPQTRGLSPPQGRLPGTLPAGPAELQHPSFEGRAWNWGAEQDGKRLVGMSTSHLWRCQVSTHGNCEREENTKISRHT